MKARTLVTTLVLIASCQESSPPKQALSDDRFQSVYIALLEEGKRYRDVPHDSTKQFRSDSIFREFNISEREFRLTSAAYRTDPGKWQKFYEGVIEKLNEKQKKQSGKLKL